MLRLRAAERFARVLLIRVLLIPRLNERDIERDMERLLRVLFVRLVRMRERERLARELRGRARALNASMTKGHFSASLIAFHSRAASLLISMMLYEHEFERLCRM